MNIITALTRTKYEVDTLQITCDMFLKESSMYFFGISWPIYEHTFKYKRTYNSSMIIEYIRVKGFDVGTMPVFIFSLYVYIMICKL